MSDGRPIHVLAAAADCGLEEAIDTDGTESTPTPARRAAARWRAGLAISAVAWFAVVVAGLSLVAHYDNAPGTAAEAPGRWPAQSRVVLDPSRPTLVMLAHPRCTCTRASLTELAELMARATVRPAAYVVFIKPGRVADHWERTTLWKMAAAIPDVTLLRDDGGVEARRFGAETSGQTLLYGADGRLMFSGGTTGARGHVGDNHGRATLLALLDHQRAERSTTPVFGCSLFGTHDEIGTAGRSAEDDGSPSR